MKPLQTKFWYTFFMKRLSEDVFNLPCLFIRKGRELLPCPCLCWRTGRACCWRRRWWGRSRSRRARTARTLSSSRRTSACWRSPKRGRGRTVYILRFRHIISTNCGDVRWSVFLNKMPYLTKCSTIFGTKQMFIVSKFNKKVYNVMRTILNHAQRLYCI